MSGNIHTNKIVIDIQTLNWRRGYYYSCEVLSSRGCAFVVEWGEGKVDRHVSKGEWVGLPMTICMTLIGSHFGLEETWC